MKSQLIRKNPQHLISLGGRRLIQSCKSTFFLNNNSLTLLANKLWPNPSLIVLRLCLKFILSNEKKAAKDKILPSQAINSINMESGVDYNETLEEALIDLYLSVKIRSNEEVRKKNFELKFKF
jgi:hypothetical protein